MIAARPTFLTLPLEIRLQIYHAVLDLHHACNKQLCHSPVSIHFYNPWASLSPPPYVELPALLFFAHPSPSSQPQLATRKRGDREIRKLPTSLLVSCNQVYAEARKLPFSSTELVFVNRARSGVEAGIRLTRALRPWQRDAVRWVGIEVPGRNLQIGMMTTASWVEMCAALACVQGLRLRIMGELETVVHGEGDGGECVDIKAEWVDGLVRGMRGLRWVELMVEDPRRLMGEVIKQRLAVELERRLNEEAAAEWKDGWDGRVDVALIEGRA